MADMKTNICIQRTINIPEDQNKIKKEWSKSAKETEEN